MSPRLATEHSIVCVPKPQVPSASASIETTGCAVHSADAVGKNKKYYHIFLSDGDSIALILRKIEDAPQL